MTKPSCLLFILMAVGGASRPAPAQPGPSYIPQRVYHSGNKTFTDFETMLAELARADVVFVGEQHGDFSTHRLERAILEGVARRRGSVTLALEMFERDAQPSLDDYLAGRMSEPEFLKASRPWPNYATDYRPLVEFARAHKWRVVAGNVPRRYASQVSKGGLESLEALPEAERRLIARQLSCPLDDYFKRFAETMRSHPGAGGQSPEKGPEGETRARTERFYQAQCVKDETMAESIASAFAEAAPSQPLIVHYNGAFHSDYGLGTASRTRRRLPQAQVKVVSIVPVDDLDQVKAEGYRKQGDYLIFALKTPNPHHVSK